MTPAPTATQLAASLRAATQREQAARFKAALKKAGGK